MLRENDSYLLLFLSLMDNGMCDMDDIIKVNRCRLHLQVTVVVDETFGDGRIISQMLKRRYNTSSANRTIA